MIISFSTTAQLSLKLGVDDPLKQGIKTVTRRNWSTRTFHQITKAFDTGRIEHQAWNALPRVPNAFKIGVIRLTQRPYLEKLQDMPDEDIYHEGNMWLSKQDFIKMLAIPESRKLVVIRFKFYEALNNNSYDILFSKNQVRRYQ